MASARFSSRLSAEAGRRGEETASRTNGPCNARDRFTAGSGQAAGACTSNSRCNHNQAAQEIKTGRGSDGNAFRRRCRSATCPADPIRHRKTEVQSLRRGLWRLDQRPADPPDGRLHRRREGRAGQTGREEGRNAYAEVGRQAAGREDRGSRRSAGRWNSRPAWSSRSAPMPPGCMSKFIKYLEKADEGRGGKRHRANRDRRTRPGIATRRPSRATRTP